MKDLRCVADGPRAPGADTAPAKLMYPWRIPRCKCYRFSGREGDVLAADVTEDQCTALSGESWEPRTSLAPKTPLREIRIVEEGGHHDEVLTGLEGEDQMLGGVDHVSVLRPFNKPNGGPQSGRLYRIRATNGLNHQPVDLRNKRFGGYAPHTGVARFADR